MALQPHLHLLVPEGVWSGEVFLALPRPTQQDLEAVLARMLAQGKRTFEALDAVCRLASFKVASSPPFLSS